MGVLPKPSRTALALAVVSHFSILIAVPRLCRLIVFPVSAISLSSPCVDDKPFLPTFQISKEKAKGLGIDSVRLDVSLKETVESLKEKKFFSF
ncbi:hypothetical protein L1049_018931 [Liquidambar formosana]|uniref:Uncharacterized protein n=1 Tax=Liquidambar formosana TaxID=63359 RepID=A0AAP0WMF3_LIQFO